MRSNICSGFTLVFSTYPLYLRLLARYRRWDNLRVPNDDRRNGNASRREAERFLALRCVEGLLSETDRDAPERPRLRGYPLADQEIREYRAPGEFE